MNYTISKLALLSGVTIRALRFYDKLNLLKPQYVQDNGYRYYTEKQLLILQQILFFKELGFELKQIKNILNDKNFDQLTALAKHKQIIQNKIKKLKILTQTIDKTITHLKTKEIMKEKDIFNGFTLNQQLKHESFLINKYGDKIKEHINESKNKTKNWTKEDWTKISEEFKEICDKLNQLFGNRISIKSFKVQELIKKHYIWVKNFWTPVKDSYIGLGQTYKTEEFQKNFINYDKNFTDLLGHAMEEFAINNL